METIADDMRQTRLHHQGVGLCSVHITAVQTLLETGFQRFHAPHWAVFHSSIFGPRGVPGCPNG